MPERWEREVGKLSTLAAPPSTPRRIAEGPLGDGMPPTPHRGQRIVAGIVAFVVFGAAAALVTGAFQRSTTPASANDSTKVVIRLTTSDQGPRADLVYGDRSATPQYNSYCWNGTTRCVDTYLSPFAASDFVEVPSGTPLVLAGDASLDESFAWIASGDDPHTINEENGGLVNPISDLDGNGRYVLSVFASWPLGSITFYFPIEIVGGTSPTPSPAGSVLSAVLDAPSDGSMPELAITYQGRTHTFFAQDGRWPGVDGFALPLQLFDASIDAGATISIQSDADRVDGRLFIADRDQRETGQSIPLDVSSGTTTLPDVAGYYRLTLVGTWSRGSAGFSVGITIGSPPSDWPPAPPVVTVPDVVGLTQSEAVRMLTDAGFVSVSVATPAGENGGVVAEQDPAAGAQIGTTTTIKLTVTKTG